jgi:hypothetical protein
MLPVKARDVGCVVRFTVARAQVGVALRACSIGGVSQVHRSFVFDVARRACGSERLIGVMHGCIVALETGRVGHLCGEGASLSYVAERALFGENGVSMGELSARIHFLAALSALRDKPSHREQRDCH